MKLFTPRATALCAAPLIFAGVLLAPGAAAHAQTVFYGQDSPRASLTNSTAAFNAFTGSLSSFFVNNLESVTGINPTLSFGSTGITAQTSGPVAEITVNGEPGTNGFIIPTSGKQFFASQAESQMTFLLNAPVTAFGLFAIDAGTLSNAPPSNLFFQLDNTTTGVSKTVFASLGGQTGVTNNVIFFGVTDFNSAFNRITVGGGATAVRPGGAIAKDGISYDDIVVGSALRSLSAPEPGSISFALMGGVSLTGWACRQRLRRRKLRL